MGENQRESECIVSQRQRKLSRDQARDYPPAGFAQQARPDCSECHAAIRWLPLGELLDVAPAASLAGIAAHLETGYFKLENESWLCDTCGNFGIFSDWMHR